MNASDIDELAARVAELVAGHSARPLVDTETAAAFLDVPASWLATQARNGEVPCRRLRKYVRFDLLELRAWVDATAAAGPVTGYGPVTTASDAERSSGSSALDGHEVPSVVPIRKGGRL